MLKRIFSQTTTIIMAALSSASALAERDGTIARNSCHSGMRGGSDGLPVARGIGGALGELNSPSTFNAVFNFRQFRDGRAVDLAEQALGPVENPIEMGHDLESLVTELRENQHYASRFQALYADGVTAGNLADALAYFQRVNLVRPDCPFLRHLAGDEQAMTSQELHGMELFESTGCASCHNGINLGGNSCQKLGALLPCYHNDRTAGVTNNGVYGRSGREQDLHVFKVPGLHNVAESGPWFHDGSIETLAHPPVVLPDEERARLQSIAAEVLHDAETLEWVIADFLRAHAVPGAHDIEAGAFAEDVSNARAASLAQQSRTEYERLIAAHTGEEK